MTELTPEEVAEFTRRSEEARAHPETKISIEQVRERLAAPVGAAAPDIRLTGSNSLASTRIPPTLEGSRMTKPDPAPAIPREGAAEYTAEQMAIISAAYDAVPLFDVIPEYVMNKRDFNNAILAAVEKSSSSLPGAPSDTLTRDQCCDILGKSPYHHRYGPECYCVRCEDITAKLLRRIASGGEK